MVPVMLWWKVLPSRRVVSCLREVRLTAVMGVADPALTTAEVCAAVLCGVVLDEGLVAAPEAGPSIMAALGGLAGLS